MVITEAQHTNKFFLLFLLIKIIRTTIF